MGVIPFLFTLLLPNVVFGQDGTGSSIPVPNEKIVISTHPMEEGKKGVAGQLGAWLGYDSNLTYGSGTVSSTQTRYEEMIPALSFKLNASVKWTTEELHRRFNAESELQYGLELGAEYHQPYEMTTVDGSYNEPRFNGFLKGVVYWKPSRHFRMELYEIMNRNSKTHYLFKNDFVMSWIENQIGVVAQIIPGDGLLDTTLSYNLGLILFEDSEMSAANRLNHEVGARVAYRFLPQSHLWLAASYDWFQYLDNGSRDSMPIKFYGGVSTPLWINLALTVGGGYGMSLSGNMPATWLATATLTYTLASKLKIGFNYNHSFTDSLISDYSDSHNFSLMSFIPLGDRQMIQAQAGLSLINYVNILYTDPAVTGDANRSDTVIFFRAQYSYKFTKNLLGNISYSFMTDQTPYRASGITSQTNELPIDNDPSFMKHEVYLALQYLF
ncbi:hypothetical protein KJ865_02315 [Myxococcota bacterium]|nr:hypothetical protein [Myxococcota bacterium]